MVAYKFWELGERFESYIFYYGHYLLIVKILLSYTLACFVVTYTQVNICTLSSTVERPAVNRDVIGSNPIECVYSSTCLFLGDTE